MFSLAAFSAALFLSSASFFSLSFIACCFLSYSSKPLLHTFSLSAKDLRSASKSFWYERIFSSLTFLRRCIRASMSFLSASLSFWASRKRWSVLFCCSATTCFKNSRVFTSVCCCSILSLLLASVNFLLILSISAFSCPILGMTLSGAVDWTAEILLTWSSSLLTWSAVVAACVPILSMPATSMLIVLLPIASNFCWASCSFWMKCPTPLSPISRNASTTRVLACSLLLARSVIILSALWILFRSSSSIWRTNPVAPPVAIYISI